jgi:hypothetical protein
VVLGTAVQLAVILKEDVLSDAVVKLSAIERLCEIAVLVYGPGTMGCMTPL